MTIETLAIGGLEVFAKATWVIIGLFIVYFFLWLIAIFDSIRDRNILGLVILILLPGIGLPIYFLFLNQPSGRVK